MSCWPIRLLGCCIMGCNRDSEAESCVLACLVTNYSPHTQQRTASVSLLGSTFTNTLMDIIHFWCCKKLAAAYCTGRRAKIKPYSFFLFLKQFVSNYYFSSLISILWNDEILTTWINHVVRIWSDKHSTHQPIICTFSTHQSLEQTLYTL